MSKARQAKLHAVLKSHFGLDDLTTVTLIEDSAAVDRIAIDLYHFTRQLKGALNDDGCHQTVQMMCLGRWDSKRIWGQYIQRLGGGQSTEVTGELRHH
jgi:hypothetical protein